MTKKYKLPKWPTTWPHVQPKTGKPVYIHTVTVVLSERLEHAYTLHFTSEKKAKQFKRDALEATNKPLVEYERKELPTFNEERIET